MRYLLVLLLLSGCPYMAHVPPAPRAKTSQLAAAVAIRSSCSESDPFGGQPVEWIPARTASGVAVSERHVLTAAHAVSCPTIPGIRAQLSDGRVVRMVVVREDARADLALLEVDTLQNLDVGIAPPTVAGYGPPDAKTSWCAVTQDRAACGAYEGPWRGSGLFNARTGPGWSGAAVYDPLGRLVGLVSAGAENHTRVVPVPAEWIP